MWPLSPEPILKRQKKIPVYARKFAINYAKQSAYLALPRILQFADFVLVNLQSVNIPLEKKVGGAAQATDTSAPKSTILNGRCMHGRSRHDDRRRLVV
jgi:hypothetical protein